LTLFSSAEADHGVSPPQTSLPATPTPAAPPDGMAITPSALRPGDHVEIHAPGHPPYQAVIDDTLLRLHVAWIRELRCGERRMVSTQDHRFHRR
jgi:hypothetical protein